jgi:hypothetical protein
VLVSGNARFVAFAFLCAARSASGQLDSTFLAHLSIHGYLSVAYGISGESPYAGLPTNGTVNYDRAAILASYALAPSSHFVAQVAHRDLGIENKGDSAALLLDWVYFEQKFGDNTRLRIGQEAIPLGIYNEIRYVGTLLPFYRVPFSVYAEGGFTEEDLEGVVLTQQIAPGDKFGLLVNVWAGQFSQLELGTANTPTGTVVFTKGAEMHNVIGTFVWLRTPIDGFRAGAGIMHMNVQGGALQSLLGPSDETETYLSIDGTFDRFQIRSEGTYTLRAGGKIGVPDGYVQTGVRVLAPLTINAQLELQHLHIAPGPYFHANVDLTRDVGLGVNYRLPLHSVLKLEGHLVRGYQSDNVPPLTGPPQLGRYGIASLALAF